MLQDNPKSFFVMGLIVLGAMMFLCVPSDVLQSSGSVLLLAGSVGNLMDRLILGHVVDWFYVGVYVNLADIWLCLGFILFLFQVKTRRESK